MRKIGKVGIIIFVHLLSTSSPVLAQYVSKEELETGKVSTQSVTKQVPKIPETVKRSMPASPRQESAQQEAPVSSAVQTPISASVAKPVESGMEYVAGTFRNLAGNNSRPNAEDMGRINMTSESIDWPYNVDGDDTASLIVIQFENFAPSDIAELGVKLSDGNQIIKKELHTQLNRTTLWVFLSTGKNVDVDLIHPRLGTARIATNALNYHNIYTATVRAKGLQNITITSEPSGAEVYFDGRKEGKRTPMTIADVPMGAHNIRLISPDREIAGDVEEQVLNVSSSQTAFHYNMRHKRELTLVPQPKGSYLTVMRDGVEIASGVGMLNLKDIEYGTYTVRGTDNGVESESQLIVNRLTSNEVTIKVVGKKMVTFHAMQNNREVIGATVNIDGEYVGRTPLQHALLHGRHTVEISYDGYMKDDDISVSANSDSDVTLKLPERRKRSFNPFNCGYNKREWGIEFNYVSRSYVFNVNGRSQSFNVWGEEKATDGLQVGLSYQPYFGYGQGLNTGLYYQAFFYSADDGDNKMDQLDSQIYIPLQYQFRLPLSSNFSLFVNAGAAMNIGVENKCTFGSGYSKEEINIGYGYNSEFGTYMPNRVQFQMLFGAGLQIKALQLEFKYSKGINDNPDMYIRGEGDKVSFKANQWSIGLGLMF